MSWLRKIIPTGIAKFTASSGVSISPGLTDPRLIGAFFVSFLEMAASANWRDKEALLAQLAPGGQFDLTQKIDPSFLSDVMDQAVAHGGNAYNIDILHSDYESFLCMQELTPKMPQDRPSIGLSGAYLQIFRIAARMYSLDKTANPHHAISSSSWHHIDSAIQNKEEMPQALQQKRYHAERLKHIFGTLSREDLEAALNISVEAEIGRPIQEDHIRYRDAMLAVYDSIARDQHVGKLTAAGRRQLP